MKRGDLIRVVAPSSPFNAERLRDAQAWLENRGYRVRFEKGIFSKSDYLAGDDGRRLSEFHSAFSDPNAAAIFVARGGYGATRIVGSLDDKILRKSKKIFMGLSDTTVLLNYIAHKTKIVTVHGPVLAGDLFLSLSDETRDRLFRRLEHGEKQVLRDPMDFRTLLPGTAKGHLFGGNLCLVQSTIGTKYEIPFKGAILFLEETNEPKFRVDRMLGHLAASGALPKINGLIFGQMLDTDRTSQDLLWLKSISERYLKKSIPVLASVKAGHGRNEVLLPIGGECRIDTKNRLCELSPLVK